MGLNHLPILLILAVVALIVFGPKRLPELGHGLGKAITEFKKGVSEMTASGAAEHAATQPVSLAPPLTTTDVPADAEVPAPGSVAKVK